MKVLIADDHALIRESLRTQLSRIDAQLEVYEAENAHQTLEFIVQSPVFDLILLDLLMPGAKGLELATTVCNQCPETPVVVISASDDAPLIQKAIDLGAAGFIPKSMAMDVINSAIQLVLSGGVYIPEQLLEINRGAQAGRTSTSDYFARRPMPPEPPTLTERQREVLFLLCLGAQNREIAEELGISLHTVKIHVAAILKALQADNRTSAVVTARKFGLCSDQ